MKPSETTRTAYFGPLFQLYYTKTVTNGILMVVLSLRATRGRFVNSEQTGPGC